MNSWQPDLLLIDEGEMVKQYSNVKVAPFAHESPLALENSQRGICEIWLYLYGGHCSFDQSLYKVVIGKS